MTKTLFKGRLTMSNTEGRSDVTFSRWTRYGKDRVYVSYGSKGHPTGYIDVAGETPEYICDSKFDRNVVIDCVNTFLNAYKF